MMQSSDYDVLLKMVVIGDSGVGKSCAISQYCDSEFPENTLSTIGVDFRVRVLSIRDKLIKLQCWDTAGQERFRTITHNYYKTADAIIMTYDSTDIESVAALKEQWLPEAQRLSAEVVDSGNVLILGTKSDLNPSPEAVECASSLAATMGFSHALCSAKRDDFVETSITEFVEQVVSSESYLRLKKQRAQSNALSRSEFKAAETCQGQFTGCFDRMLNSIRIRIPAMPYTYASA